MDAKLAILLSSIACVFNTIGLAIPYWLAASKSEAGQSVSVNMGLWSVCVDAAGPVLTMDTCYAYDDPYINDANSVPSVVLATRYIEIVASLMMCTSTIWGIIKTVLHTPTALYTKPSGVKCIIAGILALVGCILFATNSDIKTLVSTAGSGFHEHAGFAMCIVAGVLSLVSGVLYMLATKETPQHKQFA
ncbi:uncharacterized protein LOC127848442 [Dreissena polymorpha]|uniref:Claudin n=1 Tax=Dreissena polymorpha TaxID=45954 RepID=A0A9D4DR58_DREPO|nr:uncharacterized protein LOC127848442 [Dreissena polymorpha]KAH3752870.1 hypothetical protein DPMN_187496 [Dreissena polymorpha]